MATTTELPCSSRIASARKRDSEREREVKERAIDGKRVRTRQDPLEPNPEFHKPWRLFRAVDKICSKQGIRKKEKKTSFFISQASTRTLVNNE